MSDLMYDEIPVEGDSYTKGDWKKYSIHDEKNIMGFFGDYRWLSNFYPCQVWYEGALYPSTENAYQSAKVMPEYRIDSLMDCSPYESKKEWKKFPLIDKDSDGWDSRKYTVMADVVFNKFSRNLGLRNKLLNTGMFNFGLVCVIKTENGYLREI